VTDREGRFDATLRGLGTFFEVTSKMGRETRAHASSEECASEPDVVVGFHPSSVPRKDQNRPWKIGVACSRCVVRTRQWSMAFAAAREGCPRRSSSEEAAGAVHQPNRVRAPAGHPPVSVRGVTTSTCEEAVECLRSSVQTHLRAVFVMSVMWRSSGI
jgi:hypothetical protein